MNKITDHFSTGDRVEWVKVRRIGTTIDIRKFEGVIDEIQGGTALINSPDFKRRKRVSLFELKKVEPRKKESKV